MKTPEKKVRSLRWFRSIAAMLCFLALTSWALPEGQKNAIYYNKIAAEHLRKGDTLKAIVNYKHALQKNPRYKEALVGLGQAYLKTEAHEEALKLFSDALKLDRNNLEAVVGSGFANIGMGYYQQALKEFEKALGISGENLEARFGMASLYYDMGKKIWARRKLDNILRLNPFHYDALLLMAQIKSDEKRLKEAKEFVEKAINADRELPEGYIVYGRIFLSEYLNTGSDGYLNDAIHEFGNALALRPDNIIANRYMGYVSLLQKNYDMALQYFEKSLSPFPDNAISLYNLGVTSDLGGRIDPALKYFARSQEQAPYDSLLLARFEDYLVLNEFKAGHPSRVGFSNDHLSLAADRMKKNLSEQAVFHLRRSVLMNPMNRKARELLRDYYYAHGYHRYYVDEIKDLLRLYPEDRYQDMLNIAVIKRRDMLYQREGFAQEPPPRDVPRVLVLDFWPSSGMSPHVDAGQVIAGYISFALGQYGRMDAVGFKKRREISGGLEAGDEKLERSIEKITRLTGEGKLDKIDYLVYGHYSEGTHFLSTEFKIMDFKTGVVIGEFGISESGHENLARLALRAARRLYEFIPYRGKILKVADRKVLMNLGMMDGVTKDDLFVVYRQGDSGREHKYNPKKKILLKVDESDTLLTSLSTVKEGDVDVVEVNDIIYPLKKRRARMIK